jgi:hypothetical protein
VVLDHVLDRQALHAHHLVFVDDARGELVLVVPPTISDTSMDVGDFETGLCPILAPLLLPGMSPLGLHQFLLILGKVCGVAHGFPCREGNHRLDAKIEPDHLLHDGKRLDIIGDQDGDKVAVGTIPGDRNRTGFAALWQGAMESNIQRRVHPGKHEGLSIPREGVGGIGSRLLVVFFLESGILRTAFKEVSKSTVQVTQGLLQGNSRDIPKPGILVFESRQHGRKIVVVQALSMLEIGRLASRKTPIVDEAAASERLSKYPLLRSRRVEPILVGSLRLLAHGLVAFLLLFHLLLKRVDYLVISRSLVLFDNFLESLQKSRVNVELKALCLNTGSL